MYHNYSTNKLKNPTSDARATPQTCTPKNRCHNYKKCKHCQTIWRKKNYQKFTKHLSNKKLNQYKYKYFLTITSKDYKLSPEEKNSQIDLFLNDLLKSKNNTKNSILNKSEYISVKHISFNKGYGVNPHLHIIHLSNQYLHHHTKKKYLNKLLDRYNLELHTKKIEKSNGSYLRSFKKLINYCLKFDHSQMEIEKHLNLTKNKKNIRFSTLFKPKKYERLQAKKAKHLYIHIAQIKKHYKTLRKEAIQHFKNYNKSKPSTYIYKHKALLKKLKLYESRQARSIMRLKSHSAHFFKNALAFKK